MSPGTRRTFIIGWAVATLAVLCSQIVAMTTSLSSPGNQTIVLLGPASVVFAALALNLLIVWVLVRKPAFREPFNGFGGAFGVAATGFLGSFLSILAVTIAVNLLIANIVRF